MEFVKIKDYETYAINEKGDIKDLRTGKIMPQHYNSDGYKLITLVNPNRKQGFLVHRLVGIQFLDNPENLPEIDHINRIRDDNRKENLRWVDRYTQMQNRGNFKNNKLNEKHIHFEKDGNTSRYVFQICNKDKRHKKSFNTNKYKIEDAIKYRDEYLLNL